jgi:hypothetical protein
MLTLIIGVLTGCYIGYLVRRYFLSSPSSKEKKVYTAILVFVFLVILTLAEISPSWAGSVSLFISAGFYYILDIRSELISKLAKSWAGAWLLFLILALELLREYLIVQVMS